MKLGGGVVQKRKSQTKILTTAKEQYRVSSTEYLFDDRFLQNWTQKGNRILMTQLWENVYDNTVTVLLKRQILNTLLYTKDREGLV